MENLDLSLLNGAKLKLFSIRAGHSLTQFLAKQEGKEDLLLSFLVTNHIKLYTELTDVKIRLFDKKVERNSAIEAILSNSSEEHCFVINSFEGEFYVLAQLYSLDKFDESNHWFEDSLNHKLRIGFAPPIEMTEIEELMKNINFMKD